MGTVVPPVVKAMSDLLQFRYGIRFSSTLYTDLPVIVFIK